jgi:hypothetical protein
MHQYSVGYTHDARDRRDVAQEIETEIVVKRCVNGVRRVNESPGVACIE